MNGPEAPFERPFEMDSLASLDGKRMLQIGREDERWSSRRARQLDGPGEAARAWIVWNLVSQRAWQRRLLALIRGLPEVVDTLVNLIADLHPQAPSDRSTLALDGDVKYRPQETRQALPVLECDEARVVVVTHATASLLGGHREKGVRPPERRLRPAEVVLLTALTTANRWHGVDKAPGSSPRPPSPPRTTSNAAQALHTFSPLEISRNEI